MSIKKVVILLMLCLALSAAVLLSNSTNSGAGAYNTENSAVMSYFGEYVDYVNDQLDAANDSYRSDLMDCTGITASALRRAGSASQNDDQSSAQNGDEQAAAAYEVRMYGDGCIFSYDGQNAVFPDSLPADLVTDKIKPSRDSNCFFDVDSESSEENKKGGSGGDTDTSNPYLVAYTCISKPYYYMEWRAYDDYIDKLSVDADPYKLISTLSGTYSCKLIKAEHSADGSTNVIWSTFDDEGGDGGELNISWDTIEKSLKNSGSYRYCRLDSDTYLMKAEKIDAESSADSSSVFILLVPLIDMMHDTAGVAIIFVVMLAVFSIVLIVWMIAVHREVRRSRLEGNENTRYNPSSVRRKAAAYVITVTLITGASCWFAHNLRDVFNESLHSKEALDSICENIDESENISSNIWEERKERNIHKAEITARMLEEWPELRNGEWLEEVTKIIDADYIMLFDSSGDEIVSNARYRKISLGTDERSATYDFRRLLNGVESICHESVTDEVTELTRDMYGISIRYDEDGDDDPYGALIIYADPEERAAINLSDINETLKAVSLGDHLAFAADHETAEIKYCSREDLVGYNALNIGLEEAQFKSPFIGTFKIDMSTCFGRSVSKDGLIYYYGSSDIRKSTESNQFAIVCMILCLLSMALISLMLIREFDKEYASEENAEQKTPGPVTAILTEGSDKAPGIIGKLKDNALKIARELGIAGSPERKAGMTLLILAVVCLMFVAFASLRGESGYNNSDSVFTYIMKGDWNRGFNLFSASAIFFLISTVVVIIAFLYVVRLLLGGMLDARGKTICSLVISMLQYLSGAIALFAALGYLGVDYKAILASVGIASMAISFGAKDLVSDIFSGFNLLTNDTYQMGDIVEIGGYRGTVQEVNLRTTRIIGTGGNVKTIRNSTIGDVVNLSRKTSWYPASITVASSNDIDRIEEFLGEALPLVKNKYPLIKSGPEYRGVESFGGGKMTLTILTECDQENYRKVQRAVNKELHKLFEENHIEIL